MMNYEKILWEERLNADKIYLYPLQGMSAWVTFEASAERLHTLLPNIPYSIKPIVINSYEYAVKAMVIDKFSLNGILEKVDFVNESTRLVITLKR